MKKMFSVFVLMLVCVGSVFGFAFSVKLKKDDKVVSTASKIESIYSATANTTEVQKRLKKWGYYTGAVDGINGPKTKAAVKKFQKKYGLTQDGIVGPLTAAKMGFRLVVHQVLQTITATIDICSLKLFMRRRVVKVIQDRLQLVRWF